MIRLHDLSPVFACHLTVPRLYHDRPFEPGNCFLAGEMCMMVHVQHTSRRITHQQKAENATMDYAILLSFDIQADEQIRQLAQSLVDGGINSTYLESGLRPHLTLAEFNTSRISDVRDCLIDLVGQALQPIEIKLASIGFFPGENSVIFLSPIIDERLLNFHRQINGVLEPLCESFSPLYREENWVPHCTVALELDLPEFAAAGAVLVSQFKPIIALAFRLSIVSCCPYNEESVYYLPALDAHGNAATQSFLAQTDLPGTGE